MQQGDWDGALARARTHSPFLANALERQGDLAALLAEGRGEDALALALARKGDGVPATLRKQRLALATALAIGDLAGAFDVWRVMRELSDFADRALDMAIKDAIAHRTPDAQPAGFIALALGKHGARELNYSSDIDPILLFDPETLPRRRSDEPGEAAQRIARRVVQTLSARDADGYVFRVDLRLRPASEVSPLAIPVMGALSHYESSALAWERAAFIRARAAAGDIAGGEAFLEQIRPFVWRKSLDFGAIDEIARLTAQIRSAYDGPQQPGPGYDLKKGRGGIREVEFFAQTQQLIHAGRRPALQVRGTPEALNALVGEDLLERSRADDLKTGYARLRAIEHRLQMVNDAQTHALPETQEKIAAVAQLDGLADAQALIAELDEITTRIADNFDRLIDVAGDKKSATDDGEGPIATGTALPTLVARSGLPDAQQFADRIEGWLDGKVRALRSAAARAAFDAVLPALLAAFAAAPEPERAFTRWERLLSSLPSAINLFRLLEARPGLLDRLAAILSLAPPLADELARRPDLLDPLIDASALDLPGDVEAIADQLVSRRDGADYEGKLDRLRREVGDLRFALGVQLVEAVHDPLAIGAALSRVAEAALQVGQGAAAQDFARRHGHISGSELVVLGLGRLGGGLLTHASDLDIVFLFTGDAEAGAGTESDGEKPLGPTLYFNRLAQRVSAALSVPTAEGALYEVDTRLRPQGNQGPLAVRLDAFERYQGESAWTWEHMALTRARVLTGSPEARAQVEDVIARVLNRPRDAGALREDVLKMRAEMAAHKQPGGALDVKLQRGGLVDLEFLVHFIQLRENTAFAPDLGAAIANLADAGHVPRTMLDDHTLLTRVLVAARLLAPGATLPAPAARDALARAAGCETIEALQAQCREARLRTAQSWERTFGTQLEIIDDEDG
jgi:glutamate-ammonia-ligase adenylyltransferase